MIQANIPRSRLNDSQDASRRQCDITVRSIRDADGYILIKTSRTICTYNILLRNDCVFIIKIHNLF